MALVLMGLCAAPVWAANRGCGNLLRILGKANERLTAEQRDELLAYKNDQPGDAEVDLSFDGDRDTKHRYKTRVALLRRGDTVIFFGMRFRLGEFLGRGNATHVFALADDPGHVIRIPYLAFALSAGETFLEASRLRLGMFRQRAPRPKRGYKRNLVLPENDGWGPQDSYAIVRRIDGGETAMVYIDGLMDKYGLRILMAYGRRTGVPRSLLERATPSERQRLERLVTLNEIYHPSTFQLWGPRHRALSILYYPSMRQWIWDRATEDWVLVDWE